MKASDLYFFRNDKTPLSQDKSAESDNVTLIAATIYTDNDVFYSVSPSKVESVGALPVFFGEHEPAVCARVTKQRVCRTRAASFICLSFCKLLVSYGVQKI